MGNVSPAAETQILQHKWEIRTAATVIKESLKQQGRQATPCWSTGVTSDCGDENERIGSKTEKNNWFSLRGAKIKCLNTECPTNSECPTPYHGHSHYTGVCFRTIRPARRAGSLTGTTESFVNFRRSGTTGNSGQLPELDTATTPGTASHDRKRRVWSPTSLG